MQPYLEKSGRVCYSLRQFCPATAAHTTDIITLTKGGETKTVSLTWSLSQSYLEDGLLGLDSDTFYIYHVAAVMVDNLRRLLLGINLSDKAIMDFDFPGVGFPV